MSTRIKKTTAPKVGEVYVVSKSGFVPLELKTDKSLWEDHEGDDVSWIGFSVYFTSHLIERGDQVLLLRKDLRELEMCPLQKRDNIIYEFLHLKTQRKFFVRFLSILNPYNTLEVLEAIKMSAHSFWWTFSSIEEENT